MHPSKLPSTKIVLLWTCSTSAVKLFGAVKKNYEYFLADGSGIAIDSCSFDLNLPDGSKETLPWTLSNYLRVSNVKYPSRVRLYCVRKLRTGMSVLNK